MPYLSLPDTIAKRLRERAHQLKIAPERLIEQWLDAEDSLKEPDKIVQANDVMTSIASAEVSLALIELSREDPSHFEFIYANDTFYRFHFLKQDTPLQDLKLSLFGDEHDEAAIENYIKGLKSGKEIELEYPDIRPDGSVRQVELSLIPVFGADGTVQRGVVLEYDVTQRYKSQQTLIAGEKRLQTLIDSVSIGLILTDDNGTMMISNQAGLEMLGITIADFADTRSPNPRWRVIDENGQQLASENRAIGTAIRTREPVRNMLMGVWNDPRQEYVWLVVDAIPNLLPSGKLDFVVCSFIDITELRKTQNELKQMNDALEQRIAERSAQLEETYRVLQENEQRMSAILEMAGDCIITIDESQHIILFNRAAERTFGYTAAEILGQPLEVLMEFDMAGLHSSHIKSFADSGVKSRHMAARETVNGVRKNGDIFPAEASISQLMVGGRRIFTAILRDMTEKVQAENKIKESEERLRLLTDNATDLIALHTPDGRFIYASPACKLVFGYEPEELIHQDPYEFFHPDDIESISEHHNKSLLHGYNEGITYRFRKKDGHYVWVETYTRVVKNSSGMIEHLVTVTRDVDDRRRIQEELRVERDLLASIMQTSPSGINVVNRDGSIMFANKRSEQILGINSNDITDRSYNAPAWKHTDNDGNPWPDEKQPFVRVMSTGKPVSDVQHAIEWPDGRRIYLSINGAPIFDEDGEISKVVFTLEDITERRRAEQTLLKALQKEREINRLKTRFISMASHEFKTPLSIIMSSVDILLTRRHTLSEENTGDRLNRIIEQVHQLSGLLDDVTQFDNTETLRHRLDVTRTNITEQVNVVINEMQAVYRHAPDISFEQELDDPELEIDAQLFKHILTNLLSNAIKYSNSSGHVEIITRMDGQHFEIIVKDHGIGIPERDQPTLFEFFHRGSNVGAISGTGVGLAVVKQAVELQGGTITFESEVNIGTTFIVRLPVAVRTNSS